MNLVIFGIPSLMIGLIAGYFVRILIARYRLNSAEEKAKVILGNAEKEAETRKKEILLEGKDKLIEEKKQLDKEFRDRNFELQQSQRRLVQKEDALDKRVEFTEKKERELDNEEKEVKRKSEELQKAFDKHLKELERVAQMSAAEAKQQLINEMTDEAKRDSLIIIRKIEDEARDQGETKAREIIVSASSATRRK
jgi:ribonucrease Y